jgi:hypothetical protein
MHMQTQRLMGGIGKVAPEMASFATHTHTEFHKDWFRHLKVDGDGVDDADHRQSMEIPKAPLGWHDYKSLLPWSFQYFAVPRCLKPPPWWSFTSMKTSAETGEKVYKYTHKFLHTERTKIRESNLQ